MKKFLLTAALLLLVVASASADTTFKVGNLYYLYSSYYPNKVWVTYDPALGSSAAHYTNLSGEITIPSSVTYNGQNYTVYGIGGNTFYKNSTISKINLPNTLKKINRYAFYNCTALTKITIPDGVTYIDEYTFANCTKVSELNLSSSIDTIGRYAFKGCTSLHMVAIPEGVEKIFFGAFENCTNLSAVFFYGETLIQLDGNVFNGSTSLNSINFPNSLYVVGRKVMDGTPWWNNQADGLVYLGSAAYTYKGEMPDGTNITLRSGTKGIAAYCFEGCTGLKSVTLPNTLTVICEDAFEGCTGLKSITIPNSVTEMWGYVFRNCSSLTSVTLPNSLKTIRDHTFEGCSSLKSVNVPNSVEEIGNSAFEGCSSLTTLPISNSVKKIGAAAYQNCTGLTSVTLPNSVTTINNYAFSGCTVLQSLTIPSSVTYIDPYGNSIVNGCIHLKTLNIDNNNFANISYFKAVQGVVETVTLGNSIYTIPENAFKDCTALKKVTLPNDFTTLGNSAFSGCTQLENVYCPRPRPIPIDASVFSGVQQHDYCKLHVPAGCKGKYQAMDVWKEFYSIYEDAGSGGGSGSGVPGDVNNDGKVDIADVNIVINYMLGKN